MNPTGRAGDLDLSIEILTVGRVYQRRDSTGFCILKYIGSEYVVYDYYCDVEDLFSGKYNPVESTVKITDFKETYVRTNFIFDNGEV